jgi:hypothetical protein
VRAEPKDKDALRITDQFRSNRGSVYDLRCQGSRLTLCIAERSNAQDPDNFRVEAWTGARDDANVIAEWGATRAVALSAVGRFWASHASERGLPMFDWESVAKALGEVRAL